MTVPQAGGQRVLPGQAPGQFAALGRAVEEQLVAAGRTVAAMTAVRAN
jgi:hypothetical protein